MNATLSNNFALKRRPTLVQRTGLLTSNREAKSSKGLKASQSPQIDLELLKRQIVAAAASNDLRLFEALTRRYDQAS